MHKISETSAAVLLWVSEDIYQSTTAKNYLAKLDLSEGVELNKACTAIWPHYSEVILNRKWGILQLCHALLAQDRPQDKLQNGQIKQIIIAGAGLDAMGIELAARFDACRVFEIDWQNMDIKHKLAENSNCIFVNADLQDAKNCKQALENVNWSPALPSLLLLEGITYYIADTALANLCKTLSPHTVIAEYMKPAHAMTEQAYQISHNVFAIIQNYCELGEIRTYAADEITALIGLKMADLWSMQKLEAARTGQNRHFPNSKAGWIEIGVFDAT